MNPSEDPADITATDLSHLRRCVDLARHALETGHEPFGSLLVDRAGRVRFQDWNRTADGDGTRHPELAIARWAVANLTPADRLEAVVYTSGEHCPMCSAAHAWVGLGRIVYASSAAQLGAWLARWGRGPGPVAPLPIATVAPGVATAGPVDVLANEIRDLHRRYFGLSE